MRLSPAKSTLLALAIAALFVVVLGLELVFMPSTAETLAGKVGFFITLDFMALAMAVLLVAVGKPFLALIRERRQGVLGYKFKTKVTVFFVVVAAIPAGLLFLISTQLGTRYIERIYTPQVRQSFEGSIELAKAYYDEQRLAALSFADIARRGQWVPKEYEITRLSAPPQDASGIVAAAFETQQPEVEIVSTDQGDIVRAAVPDEGAVIVLQKHIKRSTTEQIRQIMEAHQDYSKIEAWKTPVKLNYLLLMGFFALTIILTALWLSLKISGWITEPVRDLATATNEVAGGNLNVSVASRREDEMGLLIESFNRMVRQMRQDKESLNSAYASINAAFVNMESIVRNIQSGVITLDALGHIVAINAAACRIFGLKADDTIGRFYPALLGNVNSQELQAMIKGINIKTFQSAEKELSAEISGRKALLRVSITVLRDAGDEHLGILVVVDDITEVVRAQRALMWQEVAQVMAHEIKNPLTPILLSTERMLKKWERGDADFPVAFERATKAIVKEVHSLKRLVDQFSKFGKLPEIKKIPIELGPLTEEVRSLYQDSEGVTLRIDLPPDIGPVALDQEQFKRVLINIIENAIQAMRGSGLIELGYRLDSEGRVLVVEIADCGPGIRDEDKHRVFQPYQTGKKEGTGLGLAISHRIIEEHGGHIWVRDNQPSGCVFVIELPV